MIWQILNNKNVITVSLFKASKNFDQGNIIYKTKLKFNGTKLYNELSKIIVKIIILFKFYLFKDITKLSSKVLDFIPIFMSFGNLLAK